MQYKLNIDISFNDKYTGDQYKVGDVITVNQARGEELLADERKLVSLNEKIDDKPKKKSKN